MSASANAAVRSLNFFEGPDVAVKFAGAMSMPAAATGKRIAIYLRLSMLAEHIRQSYHVDLARHTFASARGGLTGDLFLFDNDEIVVLSPDGDTESTESITQGLRSLFEVLLPAEAEQSGGPICNWFDLSTQAEQFKEFCRPLKIGASGTPDSISRPADPADKVEPIDTERSPSSSADCAPSMSAASSGASRSAKFCPAWTPIPNMSRMRSMCMSRICRRRSCRTSI